jgi:hypothetical protein
MPNDATNDATNNVTKQIELARLEMKEKDFTRAVEVLEGALATARAKFGEETAEACELNTTCGVACACGCRQSPKSSN